MRYKAWNAHTFLAAIAASLWLRRSFLYKKTYIVLSSWHKHKITHTPSTSNFLPKDHLKISEVASRFLCTSYEFLEVYNGPRKILTWLQGFLIDFLYLIYVSSNWWCVTTQLWVVPLIGWGKFPSTHDQSEALPRSQIWVVLLIGCNTTWVWNFLACLWDVTLRGNQWYHHEMSAVFSSLLPLGFYKGFTLLPLPSLDLISPVFIKESLHFPSKVAFHLS